MPNNQLDNQIKIINMLELFILKNLLDSFLGSHESILMASNEEDLRKAIYTLDDEGHFKESEEDKIKRLCNKPVKVFFQIRMGMIKLQSLISNIAPNIITKYFKLFVNLDSHLKLML